MSCGSANAEREGTRVLTWETMAVAPAGCTWWDAEGEWVEPPNVRRNGFSGVHRVTDARTGTAYYVKRQTNHLYRSLRYPTGRPTLLREWLNLRRCAALGIPVAAPVFFDMRRGQEGWEAVLVTRALENYASLEHHLRHAGWTAAQRRAVLLALAAMLAPLHMAGRKHGHLYPKEIFVRTAPSVDVILLDWEVSRYAGSVRWAAQSDLGRLWRSLIDMGVPESERAEFLRYYQGLTGLANLRLRGVPALREPGAAGASVPTQASTEGRGTPRASS